MSQTDLFRSWRGQWDIQYCTYVILTLHIYIYIVFIHYVIVVPVSWSVWVTLKILENLERVLFISVFRLIEPLRKITT